MQEDDKNMMSDVLGIRGTVSHDTYVGPRTVLGRNKYKLLRNKRRVWKRVQGWTCGLFSAGRREVLVKSILQAVPSYLMSIFRVPVSLCNELRSIVTHFGWCFSNGEMVKGSEMEEIASFTCLIKHLLQNKLG
ncbi:hypothetical protein PanWU01x14_344160, partial [Parasponia andersonii]